MKLIRVKRSDAKVNVAEQINKIGSVARKDFGTASAKVKKILSDGGFQFDSSGASGDKLWEKWINVKTKERIRWSWAETYDGQKTLFSAIYF